MQIINCISKFLLQIAGSRKGRACLSHSDWTVLQQVGLILCLSGFPELYLKLILHSSTDRVAAPGEMELACNLRAGTSKRMISVPLQ